MWVGGGKRNGNSSPLNKRQKPLWLFMTSSICIWGSIQENVYMTSASGILHNLHDQHHLKKDSKFIAPKLVEDVNDSNDTTLSWVSKPLNKSPKP